MSRVLSYSEPFNYRETGKVLIFLNDLSHLIVFDRFVLAALRKPGCVVKISGSDGLKKIKKDYQLMLLEDAEVNIEKKISGVLMVSDRGLAKSDSILTTMK